MKVITNSTAKQFNINGMIIMADNFKQALEYVWAVNNPIKVVVDFEGERKLSMKVQIGYQSQWMEDSIAIAIEERLELIGMSYEWYDVYMDGVWVTSSEV